MHRLRCSGIFTTSVRRSIVRSNVTDMGICLKYGDLRYDVIMDLFGIVFRNFYNQQNYMVIGFNLI